jgi:hypothetical protein
MSDKRRHERLVMNTRLIDKASVPKLRSYSFFVQTETFRNPAQ